MLFCVVNVYLIFYRHIRVILLRKGTRPMNQQLSNSDILARLDQLPTRDDLAAFATKEDTNSIQKDIGALRSDVQILDKGLQALNNKVDAAKDEVITGSNQMTDTVINHMDNRFGILHNRIDRMSVPRHHGSY